MSGIGHAAVSWIVLAALYLFLAGDVSTVELVAAAVFATAGAGLRTALAVVATRHFSLRPPLRVLSRTVVSLWTDTLAVGGALLRTTLGAKVEHAMIRQPFTPGSDTPADEGRRAAVVLAVSLAPQSFVVRQDGGALLIHAWPPKPASPDIAWPV